MEVGSYTDIGKQRSLNEDDYYVSDYVSRLKAIYAMVADGMGGHAAGEVASSMAIHVACDYIEANFEEDKGAKAIEELLKGAVLSANNAVFSSAVTKDGLSGMGTTLTMCFILGKHLTAAHIGDSRMYLFSQGKLSQLTKDHSLVSELVEKGSITKYEALKHPQKNVITRAVGSSAEVTADIINCELKEGDIILLCTDGLTNEVTESEIIEILKEKNVLMGHAQSLVFRALDNGGRDNITAVLLKI